MIYHRSIDTTCCNSWWHDHMDAMAFCAGNPPVTAGFPTLRAGSIERTSWARWCLKSPASRLFTQPFIQDADQSKHQISASLAFVKVIHRWPVNYPHKWPVTRKMFPFDDVIMSAEFYGIVSFVLNCLRLFRNSQVPGKWDAVMCRHICQLCVRNLRLI